MTLRQDIALALSNAERPVSVAELASVLQREPQNLSRVLKVMYRDKEAWRLYGPGRSYLWAAPGTKFKDVHRPKIKRERAKKLLPTPSRPNINPETLRGFLDKWSKERWEPKLFKSAQNLPLALGKLYELSAEVGFGSTIPQKELDHYRELLAEMVNDASTLFMISSTILKKEELWDATKLPEYLLTETSDPIRLQDLARKLKELNS